MTDFTAYAPPAANEAPTRMVESAAWTLNAPKVQRVFWVITVLYFINVPLLFMVADGPVLWAGLVGVGILVLLHAGLAVLARGRPLAATYVGVGAFVLIHILFPLLFNPASLFNGIMIKVFTAVLLAFAWNASKDLSGTPRFFEED